MFPDPDDLGQFLALVWFADLDQIQDRVPPFPEEGDHAVVVGVNIVVNGVVTVGSGYFLRFAVQSGSNPAPAEFFPGENGLHP